MNLRASQNGKAFTMTLNKPLLAPRVRELIALGASIAGNCLPCLRYHFSEARKTGLSSSEIAEAIELAKMVKQRPINDIAHLAEELRQRVEENKPKSEEEIS